MTRQSKGPRAIPMPTTQDIVQKLWNLCHVLRDDGVTYHQYVTELTYLLFLKMAKETGSEAQLPKGYRWDDLAKQDGVELLDFYKQLLVTSAPKGSARVQAIFANAVDLVPAAPQPRARSSTHRRARLVQREARGPRRPVRGPAREERGGEEERRRAVLHAAAAHRVHGRAHQAAARRARAGPGRRHRRLPHQRRPLRQAGDRRSARTPISRSVLSARHQADAGLWRDAGDGDRGSGPVALFIEASAIHLAAPGLEMFFDNIVVRER